MCARIVLSEDNYKYIVHRPRRCANENPNGTFAQPNSPLARRHVKNHIHNRYRSRAMSKRRARAENVIFLPDKGVQRTIDDGSSRLAARLRTRKRTTSAVTVRAYDVWTVSRDVLSQRSVLVTNVPVLLSGY